MRSLVRRLWRNLIGRVWYIRLEQVLLVSASPAACLHTLTQAAKPSTTRLHLRNLFTDGRRYTIEPRPGGFQMTSTSSIAWRRGRGRVAALLLGTCSAVDDHITRVDLRARMTLPFLLDIFLLPGWMTLLLVYGPLPRPVGVGASMILLALSWIWHRYNAVLQTLDMLYFVQVALDDLPPAVVPEIPADNHDTIYSDFQQQWQKFYDEHQSR